MPSSLVTPWFKISLFPIHKENLAHVPELYIRVPHNAHNTHRDTLCWLIKTTLHTQIQTVTVYTYLETTLFSNKY